MSLREISINLSGEQRRLVESLEGPKFLYKRRQDARRAMARVKGQWNESGIDSSRMYGPALIVQPDGRPTKTEALHTYLKRIEGPAALFFGRSRIAV